MVRTIEIKRDLSRLLAIDKKQLSVRKSGKLTTTLVIEINDMYVDRQRAEQVIRENAARWRIPKRQTYTSRGELIEEYRYKLFT